MDLLLNLAAPQPRLPAGHRTTAVTSQPMEGLTVTFSRELSDHVLRHHELFSSVGGHRSRQHPSADPAQRRSARALEVPQDPRPAVRAEADGRAGSRHHRAREPLHRRVRRSRRVQLHRGVRRAAAVVGVPRPDGPAVGRARHVPAPPRRHPPPRQDRSERDVRRRRAHGRAARDRSATSTPTSTGCATSASSIRPTTSSRTSSPSTIDGEKLTREEILDICFLFLIAGLDTVSDSLTCFYAFLANHPDHRRQLVDDPSIIPGAVEELLRWESPVPSGVPRIATQDTELPNGVTVPAGTAVMVNYGAANVDPVGVPRSVRRALRPPAEPSHRVRRRRAPLPRLAPRAPRAAHRAARVAPAHPRVLDQARPRASSSTRPGCGR